MVFSSITFLFVFFPITIIGYYLLDRKFKNIWLFLTSIIFYAWGEPKFVVVMLISIVLNYFFALLVGFYRDRHVVAKTFLAIALLGNLLLLFFYKYFGFFIKNVNIVLHKNWNVPDIILPIGISFFTFQAMSYVIDVYRGNGEAQKNPINVGLYIAFFPQLIAGPIVRYETIAKQIHDRKESWDDFCDGTKRFVLGLGKKVLIANQMALVADRMFDNTYSEEISSISLCIGAICYTFQIFYDFSGYSDMAIGLGKMFGFKFEENFNYPYIAYSITDFWRRWHISLSSWFRDYVYIPLGGNRVGKIKMLFNLLVVWTLTGFWHGASWNFLCWGWFYFIILMFEKITGLAKRQKNFFIRFVYRIFTMISIVIAWVMFRAQDMSHAVFYLKKSIGIGTVSIWDSRTWFYLQDIFGVLIIACVCATPLIKIIENRLARNKVCSVVWTMLSAIMMIVVLFVSIGTLVTTSYNPFIYFNF